MRAELREKVLAVLYGPYGPSNRQEQTAYALATIIAEVEAAAVERCAKVAESYADKPLTANLVPFIVATIRAQKEPSA